MKLFVMSVLGGMVIAVGALLAIGGADITAGQFATANLVPATLGNWVGGALLIGLPYAWLYSAAERRRPRAGDGASCAGRA